MQKAIVCVCVYMCRLNFLFMCICILPHRRVVEGTAPSVLPKVLYHLVLSSSILSCEVNHH